MDKQLPVSVWPEWKIIEKIGEGSFGKVYKAQRSEQGTTFYSAIKVITIPSSQSELNSVRSENSDEQSVKEYFYSLVEECIQEVSTMEYFRGNSHVVSVEDYKVVEYLDDIGWDIYIRMEYLTSFLDYCLGKQLTEDDVIQIGIDLCRALEYCQRQNIIHRDIKPENIFVSRFGEYKLGDFGIARELERSMSGLSKKGTFSYMAPEMYKGESYDKRVDIYSLGIVLYKLRNRNRLPFINLEKQLITYRDKENALTRRMSGEQLPKPGEASPELAQVILKACAYKREDRFAGAEEFRRALEDVKYGRYRLEEKAETPNVQEPVKKTEERPAKQTKERPPENIVREKPVRETAEQKSEKIRRSVQELDPIERMEQAREMQLRRETQRREVQRRTQTSRKKRRKSFDPLVAAIVVMAVAICVVVGIIAWMLLERPWNVQISETGTGVVNEAESQELLAALEDISGYATEISNNLENYNWIGSEEDGKISYLDGEGRVMKVLVYPARSAEGYYEEYYYWDEELFFAYIWGDHNTLPYLEEGEQKINYYYYKDGELIRWIDENNRCHDYEEDNEEYINRGSKYLEQSVEYIEELKG